tara:strand:- start:215 stop:808 length:594 start_codon:yes stop_codon:yes gene_type:complete
MFTNFKNMILIKIIASLLLLIQFGCEELTECPGLRDDYQAWVDIWNDTNDEVEYLNTTIETCTGIEDTYNEIQDIGCELKHVDGTDVEPFGNCLTLVCGAQMGFLDEFITDFAYAYNYRLESLLCSNVEKVDSVVENLENASCEDYIDNDWNLSFVSNMLSLAEEWRGIDGDKCSLEFWDDFYASDSTGMESYLRWK